MSHFNAKSLTFYGVIISSVIVFFKVVSAYGESNLKAAVPIGGNYSLLLAEKLPDCEKTDKLRLNIQQSGIYLNASLSSDTVSATTLTQLPLTGIFSDKQVNLSGQVPKSIICNTSQKGSNISYPITIQMQLVDKANSTGNLILNNPSKAIKITATKEKPAEQIPKTSIH
ncbi:MAG: hypothetical protein KME64_32545 [Scytonematopsis contorta HA4267-MV1]|jgi:hypothetical protein|nr:hypothetical protein [Scytonematopsis contorta HA4267-MV1]